MPAGFLSVAAAVTEPEKIRKALEEVLSGPEFYPLKGTPINSAFRLLMERLLNVKIIRDIVDAVKNALKYLFSLGEDPVTGTLILFAFFCLTVFILSYIAIVLHRKMAVSKTGTVVKEEPHYSVISADSEKEAEKLARQDKWEDSASLYYISLMYYLDNRGILQFSSSRTNREIEALLMGRGSPKFNSYFEKFNHLFEEALYAGKRFSADTFSQFMESYRQCRKEAASLEK